MYKYEEFKEEVAKQIQEHFKEPVSLKLVEVK